MKKLIVLLFVAVFCCAFWISPLLSRKAEAADCTRTSMGLVPINDLGTGTYEGAQGGLYPGGTNVRPFAHDNAGIAQARLVRPLDAGGQPNASGKIVLLGIGMSNTTQEFSTFKTIADADADKNPNLVIVDGAQGGKGADYWTSPNADTWSVVAQRLTAAGVTPAQVQTIWVKQQFNADMIPNFPADAQRLRDALRAIVQNAKAKYPNLRVLYLSSRSYGGYNGVDRGTGAYRSGFGVKWLIEDQINGDPQLAFTGNNAPAPWLSWGPYLYADGMNPRSDGLTYACSDYVADGTHPSNSGRQKIAGMLLNFFKTDGTARLWFLAPQKTNFDFDGDQKADIAVFRPSNGVWYLNNSQIGFSAVGFGFGTDKIVPADYDGDGKTDVAVFRSGYWYILQSSDSTFRAVQWGQDLTDQPIPADYDGDGKADVAVSRSGSEASSPRYFYILQSSNQALQAVQWGTTGTDRPLTGDFDGDGKADIAVYSEAGGYWYILQSSNSSFRAELFGLGSFQDRPVPADYDGDGKTDIAVFRRSNGVWYLQQSQAGFAAVAFGLENDLLVPADYDGDGKADIAVFRGGNWYYLKSSNGEFVGLTFGFGTDVPIPSKY